MLHCLEISSLSPVISVLHKVLGMRNAISLFFFCCVESLAFSNFLWNLHSYLKVHLHSHYCLCISQFIVCLVFFVPHRSSYYSLLTVFYAFFSPIPPNCFLRFFNGPIPWSYSHHLGMYTAPTLLHDGSSLCMSIIKHPDSQLKMRQVYSGSWSWWFQWLACLALSILSLQLGSKYMNECMSQKTPIWWQ